LWEISPFIELISTSIEKVMHLALDEEQFAVLMSMKLRHQSKQEETLLPLFAL